jgi:LacI family transcriptional regulator
MKPIKNTKRIALALPPGITFFERILKGILEYTRKRGKWSFIRLRERLDPSLDWLRGCECDGAFIIASTEEAAKTARSLPMPVVNLAAHLQVPGLPTVMVDHQEIGKLAARHLVERSYSRFAYYGTSDLWYSRVRRTGFVDAIQAFGGECAIMEVPSTLQSREKWNEREDKLKKWLQTLRPPVGMMASTDVRAGMVADACLQAGLRIPEDVALIGVDNDPVSEFHDPPLSSVSRNDAEVGLRAATLLDHLMGGGSPPTAPILIPPDAIICRRSTEVLAIDDARIAKIVAFIYKNVHRQFGVKELLRVASMSRRSFEHHFRKKVGMSPYLFISKCRVERATFMMAATPRRSLTEIATLCGFSDLHQFRRAFRRLMGMLPTVYQSSDSIPRKPCPQRDPFGAKSSSKPGPDLGMHSRDIGLNCANRDDFRLSRRASIIKIPSLDMKQPLLA